MHILLDGISSKSLGLSLAERPLIPTSQQIIEHILVDGRDGSLTQKKAYKDVEVVMKFNVLVVDGSTTVYDVVRETNRWLLGKEKMILSDDLNFYRIIKSAQLQSTVNDIDIFGQLEILFVFHPFSFSVEGPTTITSATTVMNYGSLPSKPILKVYGTGNARVTINGYSFMLNAMSDFIEVDSELKEAHRYGIAKNKQMQGEFPIFEVGANTISFVNVSKIIIDKKQVFL